MTKTHTNKALFFVALALLLALPLTSYAISRIDSRTEAANQRTAGTGDQGGTGGTGGSNGGGSGQSSSDSQSSDVNVNPEAAQALFDEVGLGDLDSEEPPVSDDVDTGDTEEQVENTDAQNPGFGFFSILTSIISRFRSH